MSRTDFHHDAIVTANIKVNVVAICCHGVVEVILFLEVELLKDCEATQISHTLHVLEWSLSRQIEDVLEQSV